MKKTVESGSVALKSAEKKTKQQLKEMSKIESIKKKLDNFLPVKSSQIWTGDFNALTKGDYAEDEWERITNVRKKNQWESPKTDLTKKVYIKIVLL